MNLWQNFSENNSTHENEACANPMIYGEGIFKVDYGKYER